MGLDKNDHSGGAVAGSPPTSAEGAADMLSPRAASPSAPPKPQRPKPKPSTLQSLASAHTHQPPHPQSSPLLQQSLEELERGTSLTSPFTSTAGAWAEEGLSLESHRHPRSPVRRSATVKVEEDESVPMGSLVTAAPLFSELTLSTTESPNRSSSSSSSSSSSPSPSMCSPPPSKPPRSPASLQHSLSESAVVSAVSTSMLTNSIVTTTTTTTSSNNATAVAAPSGPPSISCSASVSSSSLLDGIHMTIKEPPSLPDTPTNVSPATMRQKELELALAEDGFLTSPSGSSSGEEEDSSIESDGAGTSPSSIATSTLLPDDQSMVLVSPPPLYTPTTTTPRPQAKRRLSLPGLALKPSSSNSSSSSGVMTLDSIRAKFVSGVSGRTTTPRGGGGSTAGAYTPVNVNSAAAAGAATPSAAAEEEEIDREGLLLIQSARRLGLDITGLRKALLIRILGIEPIAARPPSPLPPSMVLFGAAGNSPVNSSSSSSSSSSKTTIKRNRSVSAGVMPVGWLKRNSSSSSKARRKSGTSSEIETYGIVVWVLDVESGVEWRVSKGPMEFLALHEVISTLRPGGLWTEGAAFPLKRHKSETSPPSVEKQRRLERYLRRLAGAMDVMPSGASSSGSSSSSSSGGAAGMVVSPHEGAFEVAKTVQDFVGATERVDELEKMTHAAARGDVRRHLRQQVQVQTVEILRRGGGGRGGGGGKGEGMTWQGKLEAFVEEANKCDVHKTDLLKAYSLFLGWVSREILETAPHGDGLRGLVRVSLASPSLASGSGEIDEAEVDQLCLSAVRRVLEAETFLPLRLRLYDRVMLETDMGQEKQLARKCALFQSRPQSFFGIPVENISISSWEAATEHLRRLSGEVTTLPSDKLDALVAAVREVHACYRREHGEAVGLHLGADDFLPVFIYVVSQCGISRLLSLKNLLGGLADPSRMMSEGGYCLASLEGAIEYLLRLDETAEEI